MIYRAFIKMHFALENLAVKEFSSLSQAEEFADSFINNPEIDIDKLVVVIQVASGRRIQDIQEYIRYW